MTPDRRRLLMMPVALLLLKAAGVPVPANQLAVVVDGEVPGFRASGLPEWLAVQMERSGLPWEFAPARPGPRAPHRVEWRFTAEPGSGKLKGRHFVSAQIKLYRYTQYERSVFTQVEVKDGPLDPAFGDFVVQTTRDLLARSDPRR
jgi:hypothetical protein